MFKTSFIEPSSTMTEKDIAVHNMREADNSFSLQYMIVSTMGWQKANDNGKYQDLEKFLRDGEFNTHIIAKAPLLLANCEIRNMITKETIGLIYEACFSCRPKEIAMKELLQSWNSYEDNFEALEKTGSICVKDKKEIKNKDDVKIFNRSERSNLEKLQNNSVLLKIERLSSSEFLQQLRDDIKKTFKCDPKEMLVGLLSTGEPIMTYVVDGRIVSNYGFCVSHEEDVQYINIVELDRIFKESS